MVQGCDCKLNRKEGISAKVRPPVLLLCEARSERISIWVIVLAFAQNSLGTAASRGYFTKKIRPGSVLRICRKVHSAKLRDLCSSHAPQSRRADVPIDNLTRMHDRHDGFSPEAPINLLMNTVGNVKNGLIVSFCRY